ncbi:unnamed protein product [Acanthoscelides obtectus]|uniref:DDE-1 domain-containing protein n=1 Tax=Acanthoscelides obtectus TaxID=200917 RepID=A0A9P0PXM7_ACAOB|nr:unnamed protein product [Acanthoscelides obtectus]CAK1656536.1 Pogo transposable element with KRAB domain [Acanthoscelides obtectus]
MSQRGKYGKWSETSMQEALNAYENNVAGLNEIARSYKVPKATLKRRIDDTNKNVHGCEKKFGRSTDLPLEIENEIVNHVLELERSLFGITRNDLRKLAYDVAEANGILHRFKNGKAGKKWYYCFMSRHKELSLRQPEPTSAARATGFNKEKVKAFFDCLTSLYNEYNFSPSCIYNVDETGLSTVQRPQKIIAQKGKHQIGALTSGERGVNTTCVCCLNAAGNYVPPMLIFKRIRFKDELKAGAPPGTEFACSESGWITSELFVKWLQHFISFAKPSTDRKVLLILDGHTTHTKNLEAILLARKHGIVSALLGEAYAKAASVGNALSGFAKCGIWPLDPNLFDDSEYVCLSTSTSSTTSFKNQVNSEITEEVIQSASQLTNIDYSNPLASTSTSCLLNTKGKSSSELPKRKSVSEVSPVPILKRKSRNLALPSTTIITDSPYKNDLEKKQLKKIDASSATRNVFSSAKATSKGKSSKLDNKRPITKRRSLQHGTSSESESEDEDCLCLVCLFPYSKSNPGEEWIQCRICKKWSHLKCISGKNVNFYECINCESSSDSD